MLLPAPRTVPRKSWSVTTVVRHLWERNLRMPFGVPPPKSCTMYSPGHTVHWIQALHTANKPEQIALRRFGHVLRIHGEVVTVDFGATIKGYRNHDIARLHALIASYGTAVVVNEAYSIMRVGGTWCVSLAPDVGRLLRTCDNE